MLYELIEEFDPEKIYTRASMSELIKRQIDPSNLIDNGDGTYDYDGDMCFSGMGLTSLTQLPYRLRRVSGHFYCNHNKLTTLEGAPKEVGREFDCFNNKLTTLEGSPEKVGGGFYCFNNYITTLEGAPEKVGKGFFCSPNALPAEELKKTVERDYL